MQVRYVTEQFLRFSEVHLQSMNYPRNPFIIQRIQTASFFMILNSINKAE